MSQGATAAVTTAAELESKLRKPSSRRIRSWPRPHVRHGHEPDAERTCDDPWAWGSGSGRRAGPRGVLLRLWRSSGHPSDARRETALVPRGLVAMDDLLVDHAVDDRNGNGVALLR